MTLLEKAERPQRKSKGLPALIVATLGTLGIVAFQFFGSRQLRGLDMVLLFLVLGFAAYGIMNTIIRGLTTAVALYVATGMAASFYPLLRPYARSILNIIAMNFGPGKPVIAGADYSALALSFAFITVILWIGLEALFRFFVPATHLSFLGPVDRVAGALVYLVIGILVAALLFSTLGYGTGRAAHNKASLRPEFNQVMKLYYQGQSFWFPRRPPGIYIYDLDLR
jgi:hypothetical protein